MNSSMREIFIDDDNAVVAKVSVVSKLLKRKCFHCLNCLLCYYCLIVCWDHNSEKKYGLD